MRAIHLGDPLKNKITIGERENGWFCEFAQVAFFIKSDRSSRRKGENGSFVKELPKVWGAFLCQVFCCLQFFVSYATKIL